jgi:ketosteroid isomerase-like protein
MTAGVMVAPVSSVLAQSADSAQLRIRSALETWMADFNAGDSRKVCALFAPDLIADYQGQPERDYPSLCKLLRGSLSDRARKFHYSLDIKEILVSGGLAVVRLVWTLKINPKDRSEAHTTIEPGIDIFRLQPDGSWKICRFMAYGVLQ